VQIEVADVQHDGWHVPVGGALGERPFALDAVEPPDG
jgi:hypothetical protein